MVGILDVILGSCGSCGDKNDVYFLVTVLVIFTFSFLHLTCSLLDVFKANFTSRGMVCIFKVVWKCGSTNFLVCQDFLFHVVGGILIMIASIVILSATDATSCRVMEKTAAAVGKTRELWRNVVTKLFDVFEKWRFMTCRQLEYSTPSFTCIFVGWFCNYYDEEIKRRRFRCISSAVSVKLLSCLEVGMKMAKYIFRGNSPCHPQFRRGFQKVGLGRRSRCW